MMEVSPTSKANMNTNLLYSFLPGYWNRWFCLKLNALMLMHMDMVVTLIKTGKQKHITEENIISEW